MSTLRTVFRELFGLFVDDGWLALEIIAVVMLAALSAALLPDLQLVAGALLLFGCLAVLLANVTITGRRECSRGIHLQKSNASLLAG